MLEGWEYRGWVEEGLIRFYRSWCSGLACWLDEWNLIPGESWQPAIEEALGQCDTCLVFLALTAWVPFSRPKVQSIGFKDVFKRPAILSRAPVPKQLNGVSRDRQHETVTLVVAPI